MLKPQTLQKAIQELQPAKKSEFIKFFVTHISNPTTVPSCLNVLGLYLGGNPNAIKELNKVLNLQGDTIKYYNNLLNQLSIRLGTNFISQKELLNYISIENYVFALESAPKYNLTLQMINDLKGENEKLQSGLLQAVFDYSGIYEICSSDKITSGYLPDIETRTKTVIELFNKINIIPDTNNVPLTISMLGYLPDINPNRVNLGITVNQAFGATYNRLDLNLGGNLLNFILN